MPEDRASTEAQAPAGGAAVAALRATYARVAAGVAAVEPNDELGPAIARVAEPAPAGALAPADLIADERALEELYGRIARNLGTARRDVLATWVLEGYVSGLGLAAAAPLVLAARVPEVAGARIVFDEWGWAEEVHLGGAFAARADDPEPAAAAALLPDDGALVALLHDHLVGAHLPPLVGHLNAATGRPAGALWRSAGDYIGHGFAMAGWLAGDLERGRRLGEAFFALPGPVRNTMRVNRYRWGASMFPIRLRDGCCLAWRGESGQACVACPRTPEAERAARMAAVS